MDIDAAAIKPGPTNRRSTGGKVTRSAPEAKSEESEIKLTKAVLQQKTGLETKIKDLESAPV
jgi:hypothetical protein